MSFRVSFLFPVLPPTLDGIGDHTAYLAEAVARWAEVQVWTSQKEARPIPGVHIEMGFDVESKAGRERLGTALATESSDWLILQYNPFSYGKYGFNPLLPEWLATLKREGMRVAVIVHEPFVPLRTWKFALMTMWQRWQFWRLGHVADLVFCAIEPWTDALRPYVSSTVPLVALPVGSNIPEEGYERAEAREALGIAEEELIVGVFGSARRLLDFIQTAASRLAAEGCYFRLLYVGPDGATVQEVLAGHPLLNLGPLPAPEVSRALKAMDLHLAPYPRGVSARRGAFISGLQHGLPTVSTRGAHTDAFLARAAGEAFLLAGDRDSEGFADGVLALAKNPELLRRMAKAARTLHDEHFAWDQLAEQLVRTLASSHGTASEAGRGPYFNKPQGGVEER